MTIAELLRLYFKVTMGKVVVPDTSFLNDLPEGHSLAVTSRSVGGKCQAKIQIVKTSDSMIVYQLGFKGIDRGNIPHAQSLSKNIPGTLDHAMIDAYLLGGFEQAFSHVFIVRGYGSKICKVVLGMPTTDLPNQETITTTLSLT